MRTRILLYIGAKVKCSLMISTWLTWVLEIRQQGYPVTQQATGCNTMPRSHLCTSVDEEAVANASFLRNSCFVFIEQIII
jgi:hypothetical protein